MRAGTAVTTASAVSVVVPAHNEAENIPSLLAEIHDALDGVIDYEVIYVDDGSSDATGHVLLERVARDGRLRPVRHERNLGQSAALVSGVDAARSPWIATLDGDGQNDPADLPALLAKLREFPAGEEPGMVCGQRVRRRDAWLKRVSSRIANGIRARVLHDRTPDSGCGIKLFRRDVFLALPHFDHMHRFLPALFQLAGQRAVSVPVNHRPRARGRSHYGLHDRLWAGVADLLGVMWLGRRMIRADYAELDGPERTETGAVSAPGHPGILRQGGSADA
jgi:dolichol-phosphate mannosyltransferase